MLRAVVFDFDGLIVDTEPPIFQAWAEVYGRHGHVLERRFWAGVIGRGSNYFDPMADLEQRLGTAIDREAVLAARNARQSELMAAQPVLPGVLEWRLEAAELGVLQAVASSSSRAWVVGHLERLGLGAGWDCIRCRDDVSAPKPAPELYQAVIEALGVRPQEALAVEDSGPGIEAAKAAGLRCVAVPSEMTAGMDLGLADMVLTSLTQATLAEVSRRLG